MLAGHPPFFDDEAVKLYEKIVACKVAFPPFMDLRARDLVRKLLVVDLSKRLGNLRGGALDVKTHVFFWGVDWGALMRREVVPPFKPAVKGEGDTSYFDTYDEDYAPYGSATEDPHEALFKSF
jgi:serine/threonine protein kinase